MALSTHYRVLDVMFPASRHKPCKDMFRWCAKQFQAVEAAVFLSRTWWGREVQDPSPQAPCSTPRKWSHPGTVSFRGLQKHPEPHLISPQSTLVSENSTELKLPRNPFAILLGAPFCHLCRSFLSTTPMCWFMLPFPTLWHFSCMLFVLLVLVLSLCLMWWDLKVYNQVVLYAILLHPSL